MRTAVLLTITGLILAACSPGPETPLESGSLQQAGPTQDARDFSDFEVAQSVVQESIDRLGSSDAGRGSEGYLKLTSALNEIGPTEAWCDDILAGIDALDFARAGAQVRSLQSVADAQGC